ncbi:TadE-like protein [Thalassoglobus neptunius]|uniref:TadE-like protein n=1 Tax=Thalassoglobus neptunius TaxID=1938619 RepID=A0A5C5UUD7_9PLAN|nr:TadE/TadG family type IV pilus assembly protein [Thalassoglobus neptunius]TWT29140.1 TadE-like protein [Thalassoglobus neptunius]
MRTCLLKTNSGHQRSGAAAVEFAIVLPIILTFLLGCVDYGRALHWSIAVSNAADIGTYYAATHRVSPITVQDWEEKIRTIVIEELDDHPQFSADDLNIQIASVTEVDGNLLVTVSAAYQFRTIVSWPTIPNTIPLKATVTYRQFQ